MMMRLACLTVAVLSLGVSPSYAAGPETGGPEESSPSAPPPYTAPDPPPPADQFKIYHGYDLYGGDYSQLPGRVSYERCLSACQDDGRCLAFTYNTKAAACFLKSQVPSLTPFKNAISGVR